MMNKTYEKCHSKERSRFPRMFKSKNPEHMLQVLSQGTKSTANATCYFRMSARFVSLYRNWCSDHTIIPQFTCVRRAKRLLPPSCPSVCMSVRLFTTNRAVPTGKFSVKCCIGDFYENISYKPNLVQI